MKALRLVFMLGCLAGFAALRWPYLLLSAGAGMVIIAAISLLGAAVVFQSPGEQPAGPQHILASAAPWLIAAFLWGNGALDTSQEDAHQTSVIDTYYGRSWERVKVQSWRAGESEESLYLRDTLLHPGAFHYRGDSVTVSVKPGAFGLPWISRVAF